MKDVGNEVVMASGKPKPTKYGQLHSIYDSRLCTSQPTHTHTAELTEYKNPQIWYWQKRVQRYSWEKSTGESRMDMIQV